MLGSSKKQSVDESKSHIEPEPEDLKTKEQLSISMHSSNNNFKDDGMSSRSSKRHYEYDDYQPQSNYY